MKRTEFNRKIRSKASKRAAGKCERCSANLKSGESEYDHLIPLALGGKSTLINCQLLCRVCHVEKTAEDIRQIRKADRQRDKATGAARAKSKLSGKRTKPPMTKAPLPYRPLYISETVH